MTNGGAYCARETMSHLQTHSTFYACPMHHSLRQPDPGPCPICRMALVPEGTSFALVKHMTGNPLHIVAMMGAMLAVMATLMMLLR